MSVLCPCASCARITFFTGTLHWTFRRPDGIAGAGRPAGVPDLRAHGRPLQAQLAHVERIAHPVSGNCRWKGRYSPQTKAQATYSIQQAPPGTNASRGGGSLENLQGEEVPALLGLIWNKEARAGSGWDSLGLHLGVMRMSKVVPFCRVLKEMEKSFIGWRSGEQAEDPPFH